VTGTPLDLLSLVGLGSRLLGVSSGEKVHASGDFGKALEVAKEGGFDTGRAVVSGPELGVDLSADQLQRLSHAADMAEAQGAKTAAVLMDGMVIRLDVESRTALESAPAESALMGDVDAVMSAGPLSEPAPTSDALLRRLVPAGSSEIQN